MYVGISVHKIKEKKSEKSMFIITNDILKKTDNISKLKFSYIQVLITSLYTYIILHIQDEFNELLK